MNTVTKINLSKLRSCNQVWDEMPENENGRLCLKCSNTIIDFRNMSEAEVAKTHVFTTGKVCGLYKPSQIEDPRQKKASTTPKSKLVSWYVAGCSLLSLTAVAQEEKPSIPVQQTDQKSDTLNTFKYQTPVERDATIKDTLLVKGKITDPYGEPITFANVIIKGTELGTTTDFDGNYYLNRTTETDTLQKISLEFTAIGFINLTIEDIGKSQIVNITLEEDAITEFYVIEKRRSFLGRTWQGIKGIFRKKD